MSYRAFSIPAFSRPADRRFVIPALALVGVAAAIVIGVAVGPVYIGPGTVIDSIFGSAEGTSRVIVREIRLPRVLVGAMVGASLGMSGAILQGVTRNPLADPHVVGISAGAGLAAVAGVAFFPWLSFGEIQLIAFLGGISAAALVYAMAWRGGVSPTRLALAGVAVTSMLTAGMLALLVRKAFAAQVGLRWITGGLLSGRNWHDFDLLWPYFLVGTLLALIFSRQVNVIALGDEVATSLGQRVERMRLRPDGDRGAARQQRRQRRRPRRLRRADHPSHRAADGWQRLSLPDPHVGALRRHPAHPRGHRRPHRLRRDAGRRADGNHGRPRVRLPGEDKGVKLRADRVDAGYDGRLVLERLDLAIERGEIVALVGPNGSGKSTILRALGRVLKPRAGSVLLDGRAISSLSTREVALQLALLPQGPTLANDLSVEELVWMGRSPHQGILGLPTKTDREAVEWAIEETGVGPMRHRGVASLSGGERQRAWIAMALAQKPEIMLLDEPTTFLDLRHQIEVLDLIRYLNREHAITVVMVLHDLNQAARYASRVVVLSEGQIHCAGPATEVLTPETMRDVFGVDCRVMQGPEGIELVIVPISRIGGRTAGSAAGPAFS